MEPQEVSAYTRERLGMDVQALSLVRARARSGSAPRVWTVMTEHGHFWLVEGEGVAELFRAIPARTPSSDVNGCATAAEAARRFLDLHPEAERHDASEPGTEASQNGSSFACQSCGVWVNRRRRIDTTTHLLCKRCRHAERERLRYHDDPQYRARRLAYSATRYQKTRESRRERVEHQTVEAGSDDR